GGEGDRGKGVGGDRGIEGSALPRRPIPNSSYRRHSGAPRSGEPGTHEHRSGGHAHAASSFKSLVGLSIAFGLMLLLQLYLLSEVFSLTLCERGKCGIGMCLEFL